MAQDFHTLEIVGTLLYKRAILNPEPPTRPHLNFRVATNRVVNGGQTTIIWNCCHYDIAVVEPLSRFMKLRGLVHVLGTLDINRITGLPNCIPDPAGVHPTMVIDVYVKEVHLLHDKQVNAQTDNRSPQARYPTIPWVDLQEYDRIQLDEEDQKVATAHPCPHCGKAGEAMEVLSFKSRLRFSLRAFVCCPDCGNVTEF